MKIFKDKHSRLFIWTLFCVFIDIKNGIIEIFIMGRLKEAREYINPKFVMHLEVGKSDACTRL